MKRILGILCIVAVLAVLAGCSQPVPAQPEPPAATPAPAPATPRAASPTFLPSTTVPTPVRTASVSDNTITISKLTFSPAQITVNVGENVRWANSDTVIHRIRFADDTLSPLLSVGQSYTRTFDSPGVYDYTCAIHPSMEGSITVK
jgi:plastocyanin